MNPQENTNAAIRQQTRPIRVMILDRYGAERKIIATALGREGYSTLPDEYKPAWGDIGVFVSFYSKYDTLEYADPAEALHRLLDPHIPAPDLLILDTQLESMDWPQIVRVCKETRRLQPMPILLIVQSDRRLGTLLKIRFSGAAGRIERTVTTKHLLEEVLRVEQAHLRHTDIWR